MHKHYLQVIETERKKLRAVQDKLLGKRHRVCHADAAGLAVAAERIAARLLLVLDQIKGQSNEQENS